MVQSIDGTTENSRKKEIKINKEECSLYVSDSNNATKLSPKKHRRRDQRLCALCCFYLVGIRELKIYHSVRARAGY